MKSLDPHIWLSIFWVLFGITHSLLAMQSLKNYMQRRWSSFYKYYRILYTVFATISIGLILYYQYSFTSYPAWVTPKWAIIPAWILVIIGSVIMIICIVKYFIQLSGIRTFGNQKIEPELFQNGLHKYVRHPLYFGTLIFVWGLLILYPLMSNLLAAIVITLYTLIGTIAEEKKLIIEFGDAYKKYQQRVPMIFPFFKKSHHH